MTPDEVSCSFEDRKVQSMLNTLDNRAAHFGAAKAMLRDVQELYKVISHEESANIVDMAMIDGTPSNVAAAEYLWTRLGDKRGFTLWKGIIGVVPFQAPHVWYRLDGDPKVLGDIKQSFVLDPSSPAVDPCVMLIHQASPMFALYRGEMVR
jgi:hypothetical protein